jgi:hypothetical protein
MPRERLRPPATGGLAPCPEPLMTAAAAAPVAAQPAPPSATSGSSESVYLSARVPRALRDAIQHQAIREGRPLAKLLIDAVTAYLTEHKHPGPAGRDENTHHHDAAAGRRTRRNRWSRPG